ncbi:hypothetical protein IFM89_036052 [Coptis chinensis]|uniref:DNA topoisomerase (ATP-hydrolyzing) n=1 Tax=Coptis chinensis TaxID=261450 RepID=A0A835H939_9MAGN|nr:hypothetical protein IFM89_036052 [Coptis chinensis]
MPLMKPKQDLLQKLTSLYMQIIPSASVIMVVGGPVDHEFFEFEDPTVLHAGGKFGGSSSGYTVSGGLHGVGLSVVNALSEALVVTVWRDGMEYQQKYSCGKPVTALTCHILPAELSAAWGTKIRFWPDTEVFTTSVEFDHTTVAGRIRELAFLNPEEAELWENDELKVAPGSGKYIEMPPLGHIFSGTDKIDSASLSSMHAPVQRLRTVS